MDGRMDVWARVNGGWSKQLVRMRKFTRDKLQRRLISGSCYHWSHCKPLPEKDLDAFQYGIWRFETWQVTDGATGVCQVMKAPAGG